MRNTVRLLLMLLVLVGFALAGQRWSLAGAIPDEAPVSLDLLGQPIEWVSTPLMDTGAGVGLLLMGSWILGHLLARLGLPQIVGYLAFGVLCGPSVLGVIGKTELDEHLVLVTDLAIALIALTAGGEMRFDLLRRSLGAISLIAVIEMAAVGVGVTAVAALVIPRLEIEGVSGLGPVLALALIIGTISVSNSPAILLAIITETRARGAMAQTSLAVTILKDLLLVVLFTVVLAISGSVLSAEAGESVDWLYPVQKIGGSIGLGAVVGLAMAWYLHSVNKHLPIFVVMACLGIALTSEALELETLIVAVVAGTLMKNIWSERSEGLFETIEDLSMPVYCVFFAVAGAKIDLGAVATMWPWALALIGVRLVLVWAGTGGAAALARVEQPARRWLWTAFVPQAGVSLALAAIFEETFAGRPFTDSIFTLLLAIVALQKLIGPPLLKLGLSRGGPTGEREPAERRGEVQGPTSPNPPTD